MLAETVWVRWSLEDEGSQNLLLPPGQDTVGADGPVRGRQVHHHFRLLDGSVQSTDYKR